MEAAHVIKGTFLDPKTLRLAEAYPYSGETVQVIIIPQESTPRKRKAGLLRGKIKMSEDFDAPCF